MNEEANPAEVRIAEPPATAEVREMTIAGRSTRDLADQTGTPKRTRPDINFMPISIRLCNSIGRDLALRLVALVLAMGASSAVPVNGRDPQAGDLNSGLRLEWDEATSNHKLAWWGDENQTYFLMVSDDFIHWRYAPLIQSGFNSVSEHRFAPNGERLFFRLKYTDDLPGDPFDGDIDGDGLSNWNELLLGTDPFVADAMSSVDDGPKLAKLLAGIDPLDDSASDPTLATTRLIILTPVELPK